MSFIQDTPYLGTINHGAALRTKATKLESYTQLNMDNGGNFGETVKAFWKDQKQRLAYDYGHPADGLNLAVPGLDPRVECYRVLSAIRLNRTIEKETAWNAFCDYFIDKWTSGIPVASIAFTAASVKTVAAGASGAVAVTVLPADATTKAVSFMSSNPSILTVAAGSSAGTATVTGVKAGKATITASAIDGSGVQATLEIEVTAAK